MVDLPEPDDPTSAVTVPGCGDKAHVIQHRLAWLVRKVNMFKLNAAIDQSGGRCVRSGSSIFTIFTQHFACAVQSGQSFGDLRADAGNLCDRRDQETHKHGVTEQITRGHVAGENLPRAKIKND